MTTTVFVVTAGNIIDAYNEGGQNDNVYELFFDRTIAEQFASLFDFSNIEEKQIRTTAFFTPVKQTS